MYFTGATEGISLLLLAHNVMLEFILTEESALHGEAVWRRGGWSYHVTVHKSQGLMVVYFTSLRDCSMVVYFNISESTSLW